MIELLDNPGAATQAGDPPTRDPLAFHRRLPGYAPTPLVDAPQLAQAMGVGAVLLKDESSRLGLPAFKIAGASWAVQRALEEHRGPFAPWDTLDDLAGQLAGSELTLVAATDGNHGRAVARMARQLGLGAIILVPSDMVPARQAAIVGEGATVVVVDGSYDAAVASPPSWPTPATSSCRTPRGPATSACRGRSWRATRRSSGRSTTPWPSAASPARTWCSCRSASGHSPPR
jgi:diaminopropionate ammonia-lyase